DEERGQIVKAYVILRAGHAADTAMTKTLQDHVKAAIAPYKYPRAIEYVTELPKTQTGKLQRFELRRMAAAGAGSQKLASGEAPGPNAPNPHPRKDLARSVPPASWRFSSRRAGRRQRATPTASRQRANSSSSAAWSAGTPTSASPTGSSRRCARRSRTSPR